MYNKCPVNTNELAENLSYERLLTLHWDKVARSDYWLILTRSKFADTILKEAAAFFFIVYAGLADGYVFPVMLIPIVICRNFIAHKALSTGPFPPLDPWHMGQAL